MRKPLIVIIVTLSLVCTLKGSCQYNTNDQSMYVSKGLKETLTTLTVLIVTHATQVERVKSGVCGFYATLHTEYCNVTQFVTHVERVKSVKYSVYRASHPCQEGGLAVHHQSVRGGSFVNFVNFLGLVKLQGWLQARCTANPQFLELKGVQQPGNSYISTTKLHPSYPKQTACPV